MSVKRTPQVAWLIVLTALTIVTILLQLDFLARRTPAIAPTVPYAFRSEAQVQVTKAALAQNDIAGALSEARRLVQRRPLPAEHLSLLAIAQARAGQNALAARTIQIAGQRGWREPLTQEAVLRLALDAGAQQEAARRYTALFLQDSTPDRLLQELGADALGATDGIGQKTMADIVVGGKRWHAMFLRRGPVVLPAPAFAAIATQSLRRGAGFDCGVLVQSLKVLTRRDAAAGAALADAASAQCPELRRAAE